MAVLVLAAVVTACTAGQGVMTPDRDVTISNEQALAAQNLAMSGLMAGNVTWDEAQFSSLLTELLRANTGEAMPVESITAWFEPGTIYLQVDVKEGVLPPAFGTTLAVAGSVDVADGKLALDLTEASAGNYRVEGAALAPINAQINGALANLALGTPVSVETAEGSLTIALGQ
jgi:hypothetical protein